MHCANCGVEVFDYKYCAVCGTKVTGPAPPIEVQAGPVGPLSEAISAVRPRRALPPILVAIGVIAVLGAAATAIVMTRQGGKQPDFGQARFSVGVVTPDRRLEPGSLTQDDFSSARVVTHSYGASVAFTLTPAGAKKMEALSTGNIGRELGFLVNGEVRSAASIMSIISADSEISFGSAAEANAFLEMLKSGR